MFDMRIAMIHLLDGHNTIIAFGLALFSLFALYDTDGATLQQTSRKGRFVHQHEYVGRVAIFSQGGWNKSEVIRKGHPGWQHLRKLEYLLFGIERIFVAASFRRFDDNLNDVIVFWVPGRETNRVRETVTLLLWHWWGLSIH